MSTDIDYYSYKPLIKPDRPLALVGLPAAHVGGTARLVSSFTGLPFFWLDRAVEHRAGASIDAIVVEKGDQVRREHERALLPPVLNKPTPHVIVISEATLGDATLAALVRQRTQLVLLRRTVDEVIATIQASHQKKATAYARLLLGRTPDPKALREELMRLEAGMTEAELVIDVAGLHPQRACQRVLDTLGWELPDLWSRPEG